MELLINIPKWQYEAVRNGKFDIGVQTNILCSVIHGIPLPKWHGRLIDADELFDKVQFADFSSSDDVNTALLSIGDAPTIIEADKAESEG